MTTATPLAVHLDRSGDQALPVQLARQIRALVADGSVRPGQRLPSSRALARELQVARAVVEAAFDQLLAEGWVVSRQGAGTFVQDVGSRARRGDVARTTPDAVAAEGHELISFDTGTPYVDPRLKSGWRRAWREMSMAEPPRGYPEPTGIPELRELLATYVGHRRGVTCSPEEVLVTAGTTHGLGLVLSTLRPGAVAVEDPGYRAAVEISQASGFDVVDVPVDDEGLDVRTLAVSRRRDIRAVYVTPAHQHPTGVTLSASRRLALVAEARRRGSLVVEDDYDSEFRYDVAPLPALASLSREVVYLGTAAKSVHPALRIGWLVGPAELVAAIAQQRAVRRDHPSWPVQRAFLAMLRDGHVDRLIRSARRVYAARSEAVSRRLAAYGPVQGSGAGMYVTVTLAEEAARRVSAAARKAGFDVPVLSLYARTHRRHGLVLGFGGVTDDELDRCLDVVESTLSRTQAMA